MKYILIILFLTLSISINAQDTIKIPTPIAKQIVKDLITGDSAKAELVLVNEQLKLTESKVILKDSIIAGYYKKFILCDNSLRNEKTKFDFQSEYVTQLEKDNRKLKTKLTFTKILSTAIIGGLTYLYFTK